MTATIGIFGAGNASADSTDTGRRFGFMTTRRFE